MVAPVVVASYIYHKYAMCATHSSFCKIATSKLLSQYTFAVKIFSQM